MGQSTQIVHRSRQGAECGVRALQQDLTGLGEGQELLPPQNQRPTKARLQILYLVAYGGWGNAELFGGTTEIFVPRGRLKRPQGIQRR